MSAKRMLVVLTAAMSVAAAPALAAATVTRATQCSVSQIEYSIWTPYYVNADPNSGCTASSPCSWLDTKITFACDSGELVLWAGSWSLDKIVGAQLNQSLNTGKKLKEIGYSDFPLSWPTARWSRAATRSRASKVKPIGE